VVSTALLDGPALNPLPPFEDVGTAPEVDVSGSEVVQAHLIAAVIVLLDEGGHSPLEVTGLVVVLDQDSRGLSPSVQAMRKPDLGNAWSDKVEAGYELSRARPSTCNQCSRKA